jgi:hypothetical protein
MFKQGIMACGIVSIIFTYSHNVYSAPAYGTHMPKEYRWTCGAEGDFLLDRNLDNDMGATSGNRLFITSSYGIFPWFSFDGKIGIGNVRWDRTSGADNLAYSTNFAGAYGFRVKLYENKKLGIKSVGGFQHISIHPHAKDQSGDKHQVIIDEWQGSLLISKDIGRFIPYCGARYGTLDFIKRINEHDRKRIKAEKNYGIIIGTDYRINNTTKLNLEVTFLDGEEAAAGISRDF